MGKFRLFFLFLVVYLNAGLFVSAQTLNQKSTDSFSPMVEGKRIKDSCPPVFSTTVETCRYTRTVYKDAQIKYDSRVVTDCKDNDSKEGAEVPIFTDCCQVSTASCDDPNLDFSLPYRGRKIFRNNKCIMSSCPTNGEYWIKPPPLDPGIKAITDKFYKPDGVTFDPNIVLKQNQNLCVTAPVGTCTFTTLCSSLTPKGCGNLTCEQLCAKADVVDPVQCRIKGGCPTCTDLDNCKPYVPPVINPGNQTPDDSVGNT